MTYLAPAYPPPRITILWVSSGNQVGSYRFWALAWFSMDVYCKSRREVRVRSRGSDMSNRVVTTILSFPHFPRVPYSIPTLFPNYAQWELVGGTRIAYAEKAYTKRDISEAGSLTNAIRGHLPTIQPSSTAISASVTEYDISGSLQSALGGLLGS